MGYSSPSLSWDSSNSMTSTGSIFLERGFFVWALVNFGWNPSVIMAINSKDGWEYVTVKTTGFDIWDSEDHNLEWIESIIPMEEFLRKTTLELWQTLPATRETTHQSLLEEVKQFLYNLLGIRKDQ